MLFLVLYYQEFTNRTGFVGYHICTYLHALRQMATILASCILLIIPCILHPATLSNVELAPDAWDVWEGAAEQQHEP